MNNKKMIWVLPLLLFVSGVGTVLAYYLNSVTISNKFNTMTYDVEIKERFENKFGTKEVEFVNKEKDTSVGVALRVRYNELWSNANENGVVSVLSNKIGDINVVDKEWTNDFLNDFDYIDGWYYYKKILKPGESVKILNSISKNSILSSHTEYNEYDYELTFNFESIQATKKAISDTWNKQIIIEGDNITWED